MAAITRDSSMSLEVNRDSQQHGVIIEEVDRLIRVYKDGHVERPEIVPCVSTALEPKLGVTSWDVVLDTSTSIWVRFYLPNCQGKLPLLVYFHGGGFCVGSAAWSCYHDFLSQLSAKAGCIIMSVNYRLAPENPLPAAYDDGFKALTWVKQKARGGDNELWSRQCNFSSIFLVGDSAGANIAHNVALTFSNSAKLRLFGLKGTILIQPFFGGEVRTNSEKLMVQPPRSVLSLAASDTYWRLSLPSGTNRDHPWCNPVTKGLTNLDGLSELPVMVCVSELDILKDRNLEFCRALAREGKKVEHVVYKGVGHAFQVLDKSQISRTRTREMTSHIKAFISR
ncbi:hypothetical protein RJ639_034537 [Escallonia herrerae]|uniref:Alpha/beta hydrolase fold-3 domain-containing protein n=1 Tax=Escallonia herrerae TaxID=1293975 RepID=A0AA89BAW6_9ASTE|nr:hypothetical protein RJ639_034537 [Escallonia herrerae]